MPNWKFLVVRSFGGSQQRRLLCSNIKNRVEQLGLSTVLPLVKYEVGRGREYYLGIAFDECNLNAVEDARNVLVASGIPTANNPQSPVIDAEQVGSLLSGNLECESFTIPISYERDPDPEIISSTQLLSLADISEMQPLDKEDSDIDHLDKLLYWCSSTGTGDLGHLQTACQLLGISTEWGGAWSVIRRFVLLGHLEFEMSNTLHWGIVPTVLVKTATDGMYFLSGQRSPSLVKALRERVNLVENVQVGGPRQIFVEGLGGDTCITLKPSRRIANLGCVSMRLSSLLPTVEQWAKEIPSWGEKDFSRYQIERYRAESDDFCIVETFAQFQKGLYRFKLENKNRKLETLAYFDEKSANWICGDFYGLRFLARHNLRACRVFYLSTERELLIPLADRWPMPYERALVLASGKLPRRLRVESGIPLLAYSGISSELATKLCNLLDLKLEGEQCTI